MKTGVDVNVNDFVLCRNDFPDSATLHPGYIC